MSTIDSKKRKEILVFKTSNDNAMHKLNDKLVDSNIDCLVQTRDYSRLKSEYPDVTFVDICRSSFYDIPEEIMKEVISKKYDEAYVLLSGKHGYNYGNVIDILERCDYKRAYFFNSEGECIDIPRFSVIHQLFIGLFMRIVNLIY